MKRSCITIMSREDKPLFDVVVYGKLATEVDSEVVEKTLKARGLDIRDYAGFRVGEGPRVPYGAVEHVYVTERTIFVG